MKNQVDLNSAEWCDIIFEGKNKSYGAFALRQTSTKRHIVAFGVILIFAAFVAVLPSIINTVKAATAKYTGGIKEEYNVVQVDNKAQELEEIVKPTVPEPPKFVEMKKFVPPTIVENDKVTDKDEMATMTEVTTSKAAVGAFDVENGSKDADAVRKEVEQIMGTGNKPGGEDDSPNTIHTTVEVMPQFPGGQAEMYKYISDNLKYPVVDQEMGTQGRVTIRFVVSKTGEITNIQLLKGISPTCDKEAIRVIKSMPRWLPGKQNGNAVQVYFTIPVVFKLKT